MIDCVGRCLRKHYPTMGFFAMGLAIAGIIAFLLTPGVREGTLAIGAIAIAIAEIIGVSAASTVLASMVMCAIDCLF